MNSYLWCAARSAILVLLAVYAGTAVAELPSSTSARYELLTTPSALAVAGPLDVANSAFGMIGGATGDVAAAGAALARCERDRARLQVAAPCELIRLNRSPVATGADIRRSAASPHPIALWRVQRNGRRLYLAGSIHMLKATLHPLPRPWHDTFAASDTLVVELDPTSIQVPEARALLLRMATLPAGKTLRSLLPAPTYERLAGWLTSQGDTVASVSGSTPLMVATRIQLEAFTALGYGAQHGLETHFLDLARQRNLPVHELESAAEQLGALLNHPLPLQVAVLADTLAQQHEANTMLTEMVSAWWRGDVDTFARQFEQQAGTSAEARDYLEALVNTRNRHMSQRVDALLNSPPIEFVLVGTAHMGGADGLVAALRSRGAQVTQLGTDG